MENLKIKVNNEAESKEAQELFFSLGYVWLSGCTTTSNETSPYLYTSEDFGLWCGDFHSTFNESGRKEITLPQLRDMVVLKRNDRKDATHYRGDGKEYFQSFDKERYYHFQDGAWVLSTWMNYQLLPQLKPIEKEMKETEYLEKQEDGSYKLVLRGECKEGDIEVPEGADIYVNNTSKGGLCFYKNNASSIFDSGEWVDAEYWTNEKLLESNYVEVLWQRSEEKPVGVGTSIGGAIERENDHYFINVSNLEEIDFYEIAKRYNVTDPAVQHILKKCLAVGNRGHKDMQTDLRDIFKTAKRALEINGVKIESSEG